MIRWQQAKFKGFWTKKSRRVGPGRPGLDPEVRVLIRTIPNATVICTPLDECFRVRGRTAWYTSPDEIQSDLDTFMAFYNFRRTHQGYRVAGRTPAKALFDLIAQGRLLVEFGGGQLAMPKDDIATTADLREDKFTIFVENGSR